MGISARVVGPTFVPGNQRPTVWPELVSKRSSRKNKMPNSEKTPLMTTTEIKRPDRRESSSRVIDLNNRFDVYRFLKATKEALAVGGTVTCKPAS